MRPCPIHFFLIVFFSSILRFADAQENYFVGFTDSLTFDESSVYEEYGWSGSTPIFLQIWFPLEEKPNSISLEFGDFRSLDLPKKLEKVKKRLDEESDRSFILYNVQEDFPEYNPIDYGEYSNEDVLAAIKKIKTKSYRSQELPKGKYPVILYHHGTLGCAEENFLMAEYFASRGYIFISANYHLPFDNQGFGIEETSSFELNRIKAVNQLAKQIAESQKLFYIGHSWGAQMGWTYLYEDGWADGFISLETTIEWKEPKDIKEMWPKVYEVIKEDKQKFTTPTLMIANTQKDEPFSFFLKTNKTDLLFVSAKGGFGHESYTSAFHLRSFLSDQFPQPDSDMMRGQMYLYHLHLELMEAWISAHNNEIPFKTDPFIDHFYLNRAKRK